MDPLPYLCAASQLQNTLMPCPLAYQHAFMMQSATSPLACMVLSM